jgi:hypothetical protein
MTVGRGASLIVVSSIVATLGVDIASDVAPPAMRSNMTAVVAAEQPRHDDLPETNYPAVGLGLRPALMMTASSSTNTAGPFHLGDYYMPLPRLS